MGSTDTRAFEVVLLAAAFRNPRGRAYIVEFFPQSVVDLYDVVVAHPDWHETDNLTAKALARRAHPRRGARHRRPLSGRCRRGRDGLRRRRGSRDGCRDRRGRPGTHSGRGCCAAGRRRTARRRRADRGVGAGAARRGRASSHDGRTARTRTAGRRRPAACRREAPPRRPRPPGCPDDTVQTWLNVQLDDYEGPARGRRAVHTGGVLRREERSGAGGRSHHAANPRRRRDARPVGDARQQRLRHPGAPADPHRGSRRQVRWPRTVRVHAAARRSLDAQRARQRRGQLRAATRGHLRCRRRRGADDQELRAAHRSRAGARRANRHAAVHARGRRLPAHRDGDLAGSDRHPDHGGRTRRPDRRRARGDARDRQEAGRRAEPRHHTRGRHDVPAGARVRRIPPLPVDLRRARGVSRSSRASESGCARASPARPRPCRSSRADSRCPGR